MVEKLIRKIWYRGAGVMLYRLTAMANAGSSCSEGPTIRKRGNTA
jgi:hypothetical protein